MANKPPRSPLGTMVWAWPVTSRRPHGCAGCPAACPCAGGSGTSPDPHSSRCSLLKALLSYTSLLRTGRAINRERFLQLCKFSCNYHMKEGGWEKPPWYRNTTWKKFWENVCLPWHVWGAPELV